MYVLYNFALHDFHSNLQSRPFLAYFTYIEKIKVGLWDDLAVCVSVYPPLLNFECLN
jgi:hypothetical protein